MAWRGPPSEFRRDYEAVMNDRRRRFDEMMRGFGGVLTQPETRQLFPMARRVEMSGNTRMKSSWQPLARRRQDIHARLLDPRTL